LFGGNFCVILTLFLLLSLAPVNGEFQLIAGFPPKPLLDVTQTVEEAGLEDSKVTQKLL